MTAAVEPRADLPALTGIRGIAAWLVVLYHCRLAAGDQLPDLVQAVLAKGYLAVDLFFILSGFVLWLNYAERLRSAGPAAVPQFLARRLARIWPLHAAILAGAILLAGTLAISGRPDERFPWHELPLHLLLMQNWGFTERLSWNDPAWSISCEWAAYLLFPLLALSVDWRRLSTASLILLIAGLSLALHFIMVWGGATIMDNHITRLGLFRALFEFAIGTILCALWMRWGGRPVLPLAVSAGLGLVLATTAFVGLVPETLAVPPVFACLLTVLALTASRPANPLGWRPIHYLGEISYATYLLHFLLFLAFKLLFVSQPGEIPLGLLAAYLLLTLLGSVLLHHLLERPAQRMLNRSFDQWLARGARAAAS